jgi:orotate phosphoribosyltransferase
VLRSGRAAEEYFDKYQFEADPVLLDALAERMAALVPSGTEVLAGLVVRSSSRRADCGTWAPGSSTRCA